MSGNAKRGKPNLTFTKLRMNAGLSHRDLARLTGVSIPTIARAEKGLPIQVRHQFAIAQFFGVQVTDIWPLPGQASRVPVAA